MAETLRDCRAVLVSAVGDTPRQVLQEHGIATVEMEGFIDLGLLAIFGSGDFSLLKKRRGGLAKCCPGSSQGPGGGCM